MYIRPAVQFVAVGQLAKRVAHGHAAVEAQSLAWTSAETPTLYNIGCSWDTNTMYLAKAPANGSRLDATVDNKTKDAE